jgi:isopenicillin N synthase-like dioxygenase
MSAAVVVPIIDLSSFINPNATREDKLKVAQQINTAAIDVGFLTIVGHQIPLEVIEAAWNSTKTFFDMAAEEKLQYSRPQDVYPFGYSSMFVFVVVVYLSFFFCRYSLSVLSLADSQTDSLTTTVLLTQGRRGAVHWQGCGEWKC